MKRYGQIDNVYYRLNGWNISSLAYSYNLIKDGELNQVYVNNMRELKAEIAKFSDQGVEHGAHEDE